MSWMVAALAVAAGVADTRAAGPKPVEVMVVGTYHFANPGLDLNNAKADDVLKPQRQRELEALAGALADFRPTKIMVERVARTPDLVDPNYASFQPADIGRNRDERVQVAYRLAARLGQKTVYAVDEQPSAGEPDYFPFAAIGKWAEANGAGARLKTLMDGGAELSKHIERLQAEGSVGYTLLELNRPAKTADDQRFYYELLSFGDSEQQPGADLNAMWYLRNAKIFSKLMTVAKPGDRVIVVYGAGHNYWLRHFAGTTPGFVSVDPTPYLEKAAR